MSGGRGRPQLLKQLRPCSDDVTRNCRSAEQVWLVLHHHDSGTPSLRYHEAIEQALCFGWIDGLHRRCGADSSQLRFTPRTARSRWSQLNRQRAAKMIELGLMTEHGQTAIEQAKAAGTWQLLPDEQRWAIPDDLQEQLDGNDAARTNSARFNQTICAGDVANNHRSSGNSQ